MLDWAENLTEDEMPPSWMWPFDEELDDWFDEVKQKRLAPRDGDGDAPMMQNELTKNMRKK